MRASRIYLKKQIQFTDFFQRLNLNGEWTALISFLDIFIVEKWADKKL